MNKLNDDYMAQIVGKFKLVTDNPMSDDVNTWLKTIGYWIGEWKLERTDLENKEYTKSITSSHGAVCFNCSVGVCENRCYEEAEEKAIDLKNLAENQLKRQAICEKHRVWIDNLYKDDGTKYNGVIYRRHLQAWLRKIATHTFKTEHEEYTAIQKFGRGIWDEAKMKTAFKTADKAIIVEIAKGFGAFDY